MVMYFKPHKLFKIVNIPLQEDVNGNPIPETGQKQVIYIGGCFLHDIKTEIKVGFTGKGINPTHYVILERLDSLNIGDEVEVREKDNTIRAKGEILDMRRTSMLGNYSVIYI